MPGYVRDPDQAFAIPILSVAEYPGLAAADLHAELGSFHPPQGYPRLAQHPQMLGGVREGRRQPAGPAAKGASSDKAPLLVGARVMAGR
jgi:hypothetical protein